jgi:uncharacterized protein
MEARQKDGTVWHEGELEVQRRAGVLEDAHKLQGGIFSSLPAPAIKFLREQQLAVFSTRDQRGRTWATLRFGPPGFITVIDSFTLQLAAVAESDPLAQNLAAHPDLGMLVIDLAHRRRVRLNGEAFHNSDGSLSFYLKQVYSNCPRYIQERRAPAGAIVAAPQPGRRAEELSQEQVTWIEGADTLFIATAHPVNGLDASHRGGMPGFVRVESPRRLAFPDYDGNRMFNTLGNIVADPRAGLLFPDFAGGKVLMLTGRASVNWEPQRAAEFKGAQRVVEYEIDEVREVQDALPQEWKFESYSPHNPRGSATAGP